MVTTLITSLTNNFTDGQIDFMLDASVRGALKSDCRLIAKRNISLGANQGKEIEFEKTNKFSIKMRFYQVGHNLQELTTLEPLTNQHSTNDDYFLDSFSVISK